MFIKEGIFSGFSVDNIDRAEEFYGRLPGMRIKRLKMGVLELLTEGNNPIIIYPKADHLPATFTILNLPVSNIDKAVEEMVSQGIEFLKYTGDIATDESGICRGDKELGYPHLAWFKDPAGNILSLIENV